MPVKDCFISLLYPSEQSLRSHTMGNARPRISAKCCDELGLSSLFALKGARLSEFFTTDPDTIAYREEAFAELSEKKELLLVLRDAVPLLSDILELRRLQEGEERDGGGAYLYSITEIELYVQCVKVLCEGLSPLRASLFSRAFRRLADTVVDFAEGEDYKELIKGLEKLTEHVHEVKSMTVGVNLDSAYRPTEAGVLSVNAEPFHSGKVLDKILRLSFKNDAMTCIAPLTPFGHGESDNRRDALSGAFRSAMEDVFRSSVKGWRSIVSAYVLENADFLLRLLPEIEFITKSASLLEKLESRGYTLCKPQLAPMQEKCFEATALYNPSVALRIEERIVPSDVAFDENAHFYILSGPNRGGKSVVTCAMGQAQALCQLGLGVPAERAVISPVSSIFTHFPEGADDTIDKGRLGEECARLREIFDECDENSMILLDESLSSTGSYEAAFIAAEVLSGFAARGCRGIFSTHLHELAASIDDINEAVRDASDVRVDTLVAGMEEGARSFRILRRRPDGKSYARDIAAKYGLSFDILKQKNNPETEDHTV